MHRHFTDHTNVRQLILETKPKHILELGSLDGENTSNLVSLIPQVGFKLTVLSDDLDSTQGYSGVDYLKGVSYQAISLLDEDSVDFVILDTDHNAWTFWQEIVALDSKLTVGAFVLIHDVETFYYNTGMADWYADGTPYPVNEIKSLAAQGSLGTAVLDFLSKHRFNYRLVRWIPEENGVAIIQKNPSEIELNLLQPGVGKTGKRKGLVCA